MSQPPYLTIPPLISGGVMLTYRCTNTCKHCLYRCSSRWPDEWMDLSTAESVLGALAAETSLHDIHVAGGEATLNMELLTMFIRLASEMGIPLSYLETNGHWATSAERARDVLEWLRDAGLPRVLISASMFHNEFIPFQRTRLAVETAIEVFGRGGVIVWVPELYYLLGNMPDSRTHTLEEFLRWTGMDEKPDALPALYHLTPGGRAAEELRHCYQPRPARAFRDESCKRDLMTTSHFHIDPSGNLFTGLCPGIVAGTAEELHPRITPETHPVFCTLCESGPFGLSELAEQHGFQPRREGYISKCDLCYDTRRHLRDTASWPELQPAGFYAV